jgi:hypothetical protein
MPRIRELFKLARKFYAKANTTVNPDAKQALQELGDKYLKEADDLRHSQIIQAAFPKTTAETEMNKKP